jgi:hypothetical protein
MAVRTIALFKFVMPEQFGPPVPELNLDSRVANVPVALVYHAGPVAKVSALGSPLLPRTGMPIRTS